MPPRVSVIIPNWNGRRFLPLCLDSLKKQTFRDFETVVVDNGSTDGSLEYLKREFPEVGVVALPDNRGFAAAVNAGIEASETELVVLLNNDTEQHPEWLATLVKAADAHPETGFFTSKLVNFYERDFLDGAGDALRLSGLPYRLGHGERDRGQFERLSYAFSACGAAAMYRREMLDEVSVSGEVFDEDFVSYCEDVDLSFRAQLAGYRCLYVPGAVVYHMVSASSSGGKRSQVPTRLGTRNSLSMLVKNVPLSVVPHILPFFVPGQLARLAFAALTSRETLGAHVEGFKEARKHLPLMLGKRREVQAKRRISNAEVRRLIRGSSLDATASLLRRIRDRAQRKLGR
jgi:GT2 family glycosyltransferase